MTDTDTAKRSPNDLVSVLVRDVPLRLKRALAQAAADGDASMNTVAVQALAEEFGLRYDPPNGRRSSGVSDADTVVLSMPRRLRRKIRERSNVTEAYVEDIIKTILTSKFL